MTAPLFHYKVILAEDELPILENLAGKLAALDLPLTVAATATDGERALELIREHSPHILFTDLKMPIMDGITLIEKARELFPTLKIVIISGYNDFEYAKQAIRYGVTDYLLKPVSLTELASTAQKLVASLNEAYLTRERDILAGRLSGGGEQATLPSDLGDSVFNLFLICLGNPRDRMCDVQELEQNTLLWEQADLPGLLGKTALQQERWWLVEEKHPSSRILVVTARQGDTEHPVFSELQRRTGITVTVCGVQKPIHFREIWKAAQHLRELLAKKFLPAVSQFLLLEDIEGDDARCFLEKQVTARGAIGAYRSLAELAASIKAHMDEHYRTPISVDTIAERFHFSPSYITRVFKSHYESPPLRYLLNLRMREAQRLIAEYEDLNISLISGMVGYDDPHYFSRIFKNMTGLSPTEYKAGLAKGEAASQRKK